MPSWPGHTPLRRTVTMLSALSLSTLALGAALPATPGKADDSTITVSATQRAPRVIEVSASANHITDSSRPRLARTNVTTTAVNSREKAAYYTFPAIAPADGERIRTVVLTIKVTAARKKGSLVVRPVTAGWTGGAVSYATRPQVGPVIGKAKVKRGSISIALDASAIAGSLPSGLTVRLTRSASRAVAKLAGRPSLTTTLAGAGAAPTVGASPTLAAPAPAPGSAEAVVAAAAAAAAAPAAGGAALSGKPVFAHYFPPYPISLDNLAGDSDYYATQYLLASGENGKFASTGGLLRDRPLPRRPLSGDYQLADMRTEVGQAVAAGLDGFAVDILTTSTTDRNWTLIGKLLTAANERGFKIMLQPDMSALSGISSSAFAQAMASLSASPAVYRTGTGAVVVSPFYAEAKPASFYADALATMKSRYGVTAVLLPLFLDASDMGSYASISVGFANWGVRDTTLLKGQPNWAAEAHALGKQWMEPVAVQDERPRDAVYQEAGNTETLRATWNRAISQQADAVLLTTWNDYSECTSFAPSTDHGTAFLSISKYFETRFKTGSFPAPARNGVYIVHRIQKYSTMPSGYPDVMRLRYASGTAPRDTVEVVTILAAASPVRVTIGGQTTRYTAPAGLSAKLFGLASGMFTATVTSSNTSVTSKDAVSFTTTQQDLSYHAVGSDG